MNKLKLFPSLLICLVCVLLSGCERKELFTGENVEVIDVVYVSDSEKEFTFVNKTDCYLVGKINVMVSDGNGEVEAGSLWFREDNPLAPNETRTQSILYHWDSDLRYEEKIFEVIEGNYGEILKDAQKDTIKELWYAYIEDAYNFDDLVYTLRSYEDKNAFAEEICRLYDEKKLDELNRFEKDLLELYIRVNCDANITEVSWGLVSNLWKVGYDENNSIINNAENYYLRSILMQMGTNTKEYPKYTDYIHPSMGAFKYVIKEDVKNLGFTDNTDSGIWNNEFGHPQLNGKPYSRVEMDEVNKLLDENSKLLDLLKDVSERYFKEYQEKMKSDQKQTSALNKSSSTNNTKSSNFTNDYGTATTICAIAGCDNYIASSGDTNCCASHSNNCLECGKYIDGDATYCMDCLSGAVSGSSKSSSSNSSSYGSGCGYKYSDGSVCGASTNKYDSLCDYHFEELNDTYNSFTN